MNEDKLNKSFLTTEAKDDINEMLGRNEGSGSSSFTTQLETSEGLTIGKGTENEESLSAQELTDIKNSGTSGKLVKTHFESNTTVVASVPSGLNPRSVQIDLSHITGLKPNTDYFGLWYANPISVNFITCNMDSYLLLHTDENGTYCVIQRKTTPNH